MKKRKVIGIGFHKTGTSTLDAVLSKLGYRVLGARIDLADNLFNNDYESVFKIADSFDAYQDNPWPLLYKELDLRYPNSKFILTVREEDKWIKSLVNHFGSNHTNMREWIYGIGSPKGNEDLYLNRYKKHNNEIKEYFKNRQDDLLIINWEKGDEWEKVCDFLNEPIPNTPFPHANKRLASSSKSTLKSQITKVKKALKRYFKM